MLLTSDYRLHYLLETNFKGRLFPMHDHKNVNMTTKIRTSHVREPALLAITLSTSCGNKQ